MLVALVTVLSLAIPIESLTAPPGARYLLNDAGRIAKKSDGHWGFFYCGHPDCTPLKVTKSLTGHYPYGPSETAAGEARLLESCFPVCMRKYPPTGERSDDYPLGTDATSYNCTDAFEAHLCLSACMLNVRFRSIYREARILHPSTPCAELCQTPRGVCERAFAVNHTSEGSTCYNRCMSNISLCEEMCSITDVELHRTVEVSVDELPPNYGNYRPRLIRSSNQDKWEKGVYKFQLQDETINSQLTTEKTYGILWSIQDALRGTFRYIPHHMNFIFLPDEVEFYRQSPDFISFPTIQCSITVLRYEPILAGSASIRESRLTTFCPPGMAIPDPPKNIRLAAFLENSVNLSGLEVSFDPSQEEEFCSDYIIRVYENDMLAQLFGVTTTVPVSKDDKKARQVIGYIYKENFTSIPDILNTALEISVACAQNSSSGGGDLTIPSTLATNLTTRAWLYCGSHATVSVLDYSSTPNTTTGYHSITITASLRDRNIAGRQFIYTPLKNQLIEVTVINGSDPIEAHSQPLLADTFEYATVFSNIAFGTKQLKIEAKVKEDDGYKMELIDHICNDPRSLCVCGNLDSKRKRSIDLQAIPPSPVRELAYKEFHLSMNDSAENPLLITLSWRLPANVSGGIVEFTVWFGSPQIDNLHRMTYSHNKEEENITVTISSPKVEDSHWMFRVRAHSIYGAVSNWTNLTMEAPSLIVVLTPDTNVKRSLQAVYGSVGAIGFLLLVSLLILIVIAVHCYRVNKVVIVPGLYTVERRGDEEPVMQTYFTPDSWELPPESIIMDRLLGEGSFGQVYKGILHGPIDTPGCQTNTSLSVAVKMLSENATAVQKEEFMKEIEMMKRVSSGKCAYIVNTIGCSTLQEPIALVIEYVPYGDLLGYLRNSRRNMQDERKPVESEGSVLIGNEYVNNPGQDTVVLVPHSPLTGEENPYSRLGDLEPHNLISFAFQIATGMEYLAKLGIVHRDLACRNILINDNKQLKISDFGLARESELYVKVTGGRLPLRWMSIEAIVDRVFTTKSDVWSFGVTLWEIATLGGCPYPSLSNHTILPYLMRGNRLEKPNNCSTEMYEIMLLCWVAEPDRRPDFTVLKMRFESMLTDTAESNYIDIGEGMLPYYPMSAFCNTSDGSDSEGSSHSPKEYEVPITQLYQKKPATELDEATKEWAEEVEKDMNGSLVLSSGDVLEIDPNKPGDGANIEIKTSNSITSTSGDKDDTTEAVA